MNPAPSQMGKEPCNAPASALGAPAGSGRTGAGSGSKGPASVALAAAVAPASAAPASKGPASPNNSQLEPGHASASAHLAGASQLSGAAGNASAAASKKAVHQPPVNTAGALNGNATQPAASKKGPLTGAHQPSVPPAQPVSDGIVFAVPPARRKPRNWVGSTSVACVPQSAEEGSSRFAGRSATSAPLHNTVQPFLRAAPQPQPAGSPAKTLSDTSRGCSSASQPRQAALHGQTAERTAGDAGKVITCRSMEAVSQVDDPGKAFSAWPGIPTFVAFPQATSPTKSAALSKPKPSDAAASSKTAAREAPSLLSDKAKAGAVTDTNGGKAQQHGASSASQSRQVDGPAQPASKVHSSARGNKSEVRQAAPRSQHPSSRDQPGAASKANAAPSKSETAMALKAKQASAQSLCEKEPHADGVIRLVAGQGASPDGIPPMTLTISSRSQSKVHVVSTGKDRQTATTVESSFGQLGNPAGSKGESQPPPQLKNGQPALDSSHRQLNPPAGSVSKSQPPAQLHDSRPAKAAPGSQNGSQVSLSKPPAGSNRKAPAIPGNPVTAAPAPKIVGGSQLPAQLKASQPAQPVLASQSGSKDQPSKPPAGRKRKAPAIPVDPLASAKHAKNSTRDSEPSASEGPAREQPSPVHTPGASYALRKAPTSAEKQVPSSSGRNFVVLPANDQARHDSAGRKQQAPSPKEAPQAPRVEPPDVIDLASDSDAPALPAPARCVSDLRVSPSLGSLPIIIQLLAALLCSELAAKSALPCQCKQRVKKGAFVSQVMILRSFRGNLTWLRKHIDQGHDG